MSSCARRLVSQTGMFVRPLFNSGMPLFNPCDCSSVCPSRISNHHRFQAFLFSMNALQDVVGDMDREDRSGSFFNLSAESGRHIQDRNLQNDVESQNFYRKLDKLSKGRDSFSSLMNASSSSDWLSDSFDSTSDGLTGKLEKAATYFQFDDEEITKEDYSFRPDIMFRQGTTYNTKDLDLSKERPNRLTKRQSFEVTTKEVLSKADFRNVKFLANFITEAGIIIKRSQTGISAKAQRKVAKEIKTARAFGLLPFTTMGTKSFVFGKNMEPVERDYEYEPYDSFVTANDIEKDVF